MLFRDATPADIPQMRLLEQTSPAAAHWAPEHYDSLFVPEPAERIVLAATHDAAARSILGFLVARRLPDEWEIETIVVDATARRQGIASGLIQVLTARARSAEVGSIILEVRESNAAARQLYEKIGFKQEARRLNYYQNPTEDALLYRFCLRSCDKIC